MKDRIIQFLKDFNLTSTKFADEIGVQRSSISHILSGRNKPSYDFIEKMLSAYPEINAQWLITGKGEMYNNTSIKSAEPNLFSQDKKLNTELSSRDLNIAKSFGNTQDLSDSEKEIIDTKKNSSEKNENVPKIKRIVLFYSDDTFIDYTPQ